MTRLPAETIGDAYTSTYHFDVLEDLVDIGNRMAGQQGEMKGAERVAEAYRDIGLRNVRIEEFGIPGWWRGSSTLSTSWQHESTYKADHEVIALPGSPSGQAEAELVDVGYGLPADFEEADLEGNIAMASSATPGDHDRWIHRMEKYCYAIDEGAVGFVFRNHIEGCLPPTGEVGYNNRPGPIPAVGVSKEVGTTLERQAKEGIELAIHVECRNEPATSRNVSGILGPDTDEEVLLTAHVDAHDIAQGAQDNGAGTVLVVEIARLMTQVKDALDTKVRCVVFGSEEIGLRGAYHLSDTVDLDAVRAVINIDGAGRNPTLSVGTNQFDKLEALFEEVTNDFRVPLDTQTNVRPHGDQWAFVQEGVPGVILSSTNPDDSGRGWGHTHADTLDKIDIQDLRNHAIWVGNAVCAASEGDREFSRRSADETRELIDEGYEQELRIGGRWPYE